MPVNNATGGGGASADHNHTGPGDGGELTNDKHDGYVDISNISTPTNPPQNSIRLYTLVNGNNLEFRARFFSGDDILLHSGSNISAGGPSPGDSMGLLLAIPYG